jgi:hypothetical protein
MDPFLLLKGAGGIAGALSGMAAKNAQLKRVEEDYTKRAYGTLENALEQNRNLNPEATRQAAAQTLSTGLSAAQDNAANMVAGQVANQGGGVIGGQAGVAGASAVQAASTPYLQQMASLQGQKLQAEQQQVAQTESIGNSIGNLSNQISYLQEQKANPLKSILEGAVAGVTGGGSIANILEPELGKGSIQTTDQETPVVDPSTGQPPVAEPVIAQSDKRRMKAEDMLLQDTQLASLLGGLGSLGMNALAGR